MNGHYEPGRLVLDSWRIQRKLGEGNFGKVWEIQREDFGQRYTAALKVMTVPKSEAELRGAMEEGMDSAAAQQYFYSVVEDIVGEFALMSRLKGTAHVVSYEDHRVVRHGEGIGWDILIRMELLTPLLTHAYAHPFTRRDIIRLGIDLCRALELCQRYNILHRDIKPENIFVSPNGDFKLGDFGIARTVEKTMSGLSKKGTYNYMAPEVYRGGEYGFSVDTYSLGIVLYRLLNRNRIPFMPPAPQPITYASRERALALRMGGEAIPPPVYAQGRLAEIVVKAVSYNPKERYSSPAQMRQELEAIMYDSADAQIIYPQGDEVQLAENVYISKTPGPVAADADAWDSADATQSIFSGQPAESRAEGDAQSLLIPGGQDTDFGDRTESIFSGPAPAQGGAKKPRPRRARPSAPKPRPRWLALTAALLVVAALTAAVLMQRDAAQRAEALKLAGQQQQQAHYQALMDEAAGLYSVDPQRAARLLLEAQQLEPQSAQAFVGYAYALYLSRDYDGCITYIEDTLALGKAYGIAQQSQLSEILGAAYFERADYAAAASFFRLSTAGGDITLPAMRDYAVALGRLGDVHAAAAVLDSMLAAGANQLETRYVQAEIDLAQKEYPAAESGFLAVLAEADDDLARRALRAAAELYRDCAALDMLGTSPVASPAQKGAELLAGGMTAYGLSYDSTLWEMLAQAYYNAYQADTGLGRGWLEKAADAFERVLDLGIQKSYLYSNLFAVYYELAEYEQAEAVLVDMEAAYGQSYTPHALRCMLLITLENAKPEAQRDFSAAWSAYQQAHSLLASGDDMTYWGQIQGLVDDLRQKGWL